MREVDRYKCQNITALKRAGQEQVGRGALVHRRPGLRTGCESKSSRLV